MEVYVDQDCLERPSEEVEEICQNHVERFHVVYQVLSELFPTSLQFPSEKGGKELNASQGVSNLMGNASCHFSHGTHPAYPLCLFL